jgi:ferrochelatase
MAQARSRGARRKEQVMAEKKGVLLVNLGSPAAPTTKAVRAYLRQFLSDKRIIELTPLLWLPILYGIILPIRSSRSAQLYKSIWRKNEDGQFTEDAPLIEICREQSDKLSKILPPDTPVEMAMRFGQPSIKSGIENLVRAGCTRIVVLPLYPQYAWATTASLEDEIGRVMAGTSAPPDVSVIEHYYQNKGYIEAIAYSLKRHLAGLDFKPDSVLVSFHGIPRSNSAKGDPYETQCQETFAMLSTTLEQYLHPQGIDLQLCYQSRFGPKKWLGPDTCECLEKMTRSGKNNAVVITPGFSSDCLETLEEIALGECKAYLEKGGKNFSLVPCLNADDDHIKMLHNVLCEHTSF